MTLQEMIPERGSERSETSLPVRVEDFSDLQVEFNKQQEDQGTREVMGRVFMNPKSPAQVFYSRVRYRPM